MKKLAEKILERADYDYVEISDGVHIAHKSVIMEDVGQYLEDYYDEDSENLDQFEKEIYYITTNDGETIEIYDEEDLIDHIQDYLYEEEIKELEDRIM